VTTLRRPYPPDSLTTQQAAAVLGVNVDTVMRWLAEGRLTELEAPIGRRPRFFSQAEVEALAIRRKGRPLPRQWRGLDLSVVTLDSPVRARFWLKVDRNGPAPAHRPEIGPCWLYTEHVTESGYGQFTLQKGGQRLAHVVSYALSRGPVPPRAYVCHHCDNPPCVRPEHLFLGSGADNARDCISKGRARRAQGADTAAARLNDEAVRAIRAVEPYHGRTRDLARTYGVSDRTINAVLLGETWRHVS
jgi:excisionase family DNA binding protein